MNRRPQGPFRALLMVGFAVSSLPVHAGSDAVHGEQLYARCMACHALTVDRVGPRHCGLLGRRAGSVAGFNYSAAMKKSGLVWNEDTLNRFLRKPLDLVPSSSMTYDGVPEARDRKDLIAYLKLAGKSAACRALPS
jgi:cytochrome c